MPTSWRGTSATICPHVRTIPHHPAPPRYDRYGEGMYYAAFRKNRTTTWYAFFTL